jgi:hypothetical protein
VAAACIALAAGVGPASAQSSALKGRRDFAVGDQPVGIIAADIDGDSYIDLIVANRNTNGSGDLTQMKGFGDGTFKKVGSVIAGTQPIGAALRDVNGDGALDIVTANRTSRNVTVNFGNGMGSFGARISTSVSANPLSLAVGDWNGDGRLDIATLNDDNVSTMVGDGAGHFTTLRQFAVPVGGKQIVSADFNIDGKADLAIVNNFNNNVQIFRGDGTGVFSLSNTLATNFGPAQMAVADLNADGRLDIVVSNNGADNLSIFLATAQGGFGNPSTISSGYGPRAILVGDVSGDGKADLVVTQSKISQVGEVAVLNGTGTGTFGAPAVFNGGPVPNSAAVADFNRDGRLDVATANLTGNTVSILQNAGAGAFINAGKVTLPVGSFPHAVVMADFNKDGKVDFASANEQNNNVSIGSGDGTTCTFTGVSSANNTGITPFKMVVGDFNRDGNLDIVTANNGDDSYSYLQGNGVSNFTVTTRPAGCVGPVDISNGEITGDQLQDVVAVCEEGSSVPGGYCAQLNTGGSGSSTFGSPVCVDSLVNGPAGVSVGNYNGVIDSLEDIAITAERDSRVMVGISDGTGHLLEIPAAAFGVGLLPKGVTRGDLNGDGYLDLVVANSGSNTITAMLGDGGGIFSVPVITTSVGQAPTDVVLAFFNGDAWLDAAVVNTNANNVTLLLGDGHGHFSTLGDYGVRDAPISIAAGDCNGDGKTDLVVADNFDDTITILTNQLSAGDPLQALDVTGQGQTYIRWGVVAGGAYDVIRGLIRSVRQTATSFDLGSVTCLANDLADPGVSTDASAPPVGDAFFYLVRATIEGTPGSYTVATNGKPGVPAGGDCP